MILDPKKKATTLAGPRYVPEKFKELDLSDEKHLAMRAVMERLRQPKLISMNSRAKVNVLEGWK